MPLFNRRPATSSGPAPSIVRNRCWNDPDLDRLVDSIVGPDPDRDSQVTAVLSRLRSQQADPEAHVLTTDAVANVLAASPERIDAVRRASASAAAGTRESADALGLLARTLVGEAWDVRGAGRANTVSTDSFRTFHAILEEAEDVGWAALQADPAHPAAGVSRLVSGRGLGLPEDEWWHRFDVARRSKPTLYPAYSHMLQALCKKWYGSHELMFDLARRAAAESPPGDPVGAMLGVAHAEYMVEEGRASVPEADLALATASADRWVAGGEPALQHPRAVEAHNVFGWLLRADPARRYFHLSRVNGRISWAPWDYLDNGSDVFARLLAKGTKK